MPNADLPQQPLSLCGLFGIGYVSQAIASPDGSMVAVAGSDVVVLIDGTTGAELRRILPTGSPTALAFSPDAQLLATGDENTIALWHTADGSFVRSIAAGAGLGMAFSPDGSLVINSTPAAYRVADGTKAWSLSAPFFSAVAPDGSVAVTSDDQRHMILVDASTGATRVTGAALDPTAQDGIVALSPGGLLATVSSTGAVELQKPTDTSPELTLTPASMVTALAFSRDGARLMASEQGGSVAVWDASTGSKIAVVPVGFPQPFGAQPTTDGHGLLLMPKRSEVQWFDLDTNAARFTYSWGHTDELIDARFSPDGSEVASVGNDGTLRLWDAASAAPRQVLSQPNEPASAVAYSADGSFLYLAADLYVYQYARSTLSVVERMGPAPSEITQIDVSPDGTLVAGTEEFVGTDVWRASDGAKVLTIPASSQSRSLAFAFTPDGTQLVRIDDLDDLGVYSLSDGSRVANVPAGGSNDYGVFEQLAFTPAGDKLLTTLGASVAAKAWPGLSTVATLGPDSADVWCFAISPSGQQALTSSGDQSLRLWRISDGAAIALGSLASVPSAGHDTMRFAPNDPTRLLVGDWAPRLYCTPTGQPGLIK
jgi:WD40 repeat protein